MTQQSPARVAIVGGGPAGLMAAETVRAAGYDVDLYDSMGSPGRKFLLAGKGGLNLTHGEPFEPFVQRYGGRRDEVARWLRVFGADDLRAWAHGLSVDTFTGSSGRVFPRDMKAAPLLRGWVRRLHAQGVCFHMHHRWQGWTADGALRFDTATGEHFIATDAVVLALGGGSWPQLGSDGSWVPVMRDAGVALAPLQPANCGFEIDWSEHLRSRFAGTPLKAVVAHWTSADGVARARQGECVLSEYGIEGSLIYAIGADLRQQLAAGRGGVLRLDLAPGRQQAELALRLGAPRGKHSLGDWLRRRAGLDAVKCALVFETADKATLADPQALAAWIKALPLRLRAPRPLAEAISTAGGVRLDALDERLMVQVRPGVFCAGEMLDWEAPTGGYLLTACFASGRLAAQGVVDWLKEQRRAP
ncbi:TIGR03862 family flavoprotein [Dyella sp. A6]|uniref:TIGR03862 family flavoprotein n=1 Tax=Dyella aluminiiresistens TaxID=3069105 RepID=UPI002E77371E|nr:TIGR03862 family flavoprotein [Dyella sp. A6]